MKELSIEEKAKRYDVAIERAKAYQGLRSEMEIIFPELKESGDFKIRRELLSFLNERSDDYYIPTSWIAYLEKQVEQEIVSKVKIGEKYRCCNSVRYTCFQIGKVYEVKDSFDAAMISLCSDCFVLVDDSVEQKSADKIEPKFKKGDWVVCNNGSHPIFQVIERSWPNAKYRDIKGTEIFLNVKTLEKQYHLWTIQDAKDGDVLVNKDASYIVLFKRFSYSEDDIDRFKSHCHCREGVFCSIEDVGWCCNGFHPATKEQRDTLIKAMTDAGYTFDFESKELKKIEQKPVDITDEWIEEYWQHEKVNNPYSYNKGDEIQFDYQGFVSFCKKYCQNSAWSEEDEKHYQGCLNLMKLSLDTKPYPYYNDYLWLKSLKDRIQPQPKQEWSEEDEEMFGYALDMIEWYSGKHEDKTRLVSNWFKVLKDRVGNFDNGYKVGFSAAEHNQWKPSDEQFKVLNEVLNFAATHESPYWNDYIFGTLNNLRKQLKKLREE